MTLMRKLFFMLVLVGTMTLAGCTLSQMVKMAKDQELKVEPSPLELHADTVNFSMSATLPPKMLKKGKVYRVNTYYQYSNEQMLRLDSIDFNADDYQDTDAQPKESQDFVFAYDPAYKKGEVMVQGKAINPKNGKYKETEMMPVARGVITTSLLVEDVYYAAYADHGYSNEETLIPTNVDFFFERGSSNLRTSEKKSDRGEALKAFIAEKNVTRTVTITGAHSPEGSETKNTNLAQERAEVIEKYYRDQMSKYDYKGLADSIKFILKPVVRDWGPFKMMLKEYDGISESEKAEFITIINGEGTFEEKEDQLQKLSGYDKVFDDIYPELRTAKTEILSVEPKLSDPEIAALAKQIVNEEVSADTLSDEELLYAATLTPSLTEKEGIYKAATKKNDSWASHNNLGAVYLEMAMKGGDAEMNKYGEMAVTQFEIANNKQENAESYANMGTVYLMQGNRHKALDALNKAASMNPSNETLRGLNAVKGVAEIKAAKYDNAVNSLSNTEETSDNLFNKGLAQLLKRDFENAITSFNEANNVDANHAKAYYGTAVANARLKNEAEVYSNLEKAVTNNSSLKQEALDDLEFRNYNETEAFKNALK